MHTMPLLEKSQHLLKSFSRDSKRKSLLKNTSVWWILHC